MESPAKARTIAGYLGDDYVVESSIGHIRDLPRNAADVPKEYKGQAWARLGVDTENHFKPLYIVSPEKRDHVRHLKAALKDADELYLATDEDREGEAIAWHLLEVLNPRVPVRRMVFHEITPEAIRHAIDHPRELDRRLVDAQETRRILDRLVGYEVSPVLWKKVNRGLSAGRVQSVATRVVVERERERMAFHAGAWWDLQAMFHHDDIAKDQTPFSAGLVELGGRRLGSGKDFGQDGLLTAGARNAGVVLLDEAGATAVRDALTDRPVAVRSVERKPYTRKPSPPFMTSTLQQEAGRKLRMSASMAMSTAQRLYENGYITYMRTDSTTLSQAALDAARRQIRERYGDDYVPEAPRTYANKVKNAQEAHEAIRPAGDSFRTPDQVKGELQNAEFRLYELIWQRTVASQMNDARGESVQVRMAATTAPVSVPDASGELGPSAEQDAVFAASGRTILFPGFLRAYVEGSDDPDAALDDQERILPDMATGDAVSADELTVAGHETQPPARYTEASLVKRLEELGVGRPSTYASTISTVQDRGYVWKKGSALVPSFTAFAVITLLEQHFPTLVDYAFTASMEEDLDRIAGGTEEMEPWLSRFYFGTSGARIAGDDVDGGDRQKGATSTSGDGLALKHLVADLEDIDARAVNSILLGADADSVPIVARVGRYGPYLERGEGDDVQRASIPEDTPPDELTPARAIELLEAPSGDRDLGTHPDTGLIVHLKAGRFGPYVQEGEHDDETGLKPRTASLFASMDPAEVTLEQVLPLLELPRDVGVDPADGVEITTQNGRYGPYLKKGTDSRSLESEEQILTLSLDEALAILAQPKRRRGQAAPKPPLKEMGLDPDTERPIVVKDGRFGPYVTDGETNASLRKGDSLEELTMDRALELLAERRAKGPSKKKATKKKAPAKKKAAAKKKAPAKKKAAAKRKSPAKKKAASEPDDAPPAPDGGE
ncbi:MAG TPA: type I DNA topoisomerase [Microthrixaceae bacterium]|nr:type I DNA topoisomerase [Microthrixaceae bacterium]